MDGNLAPIWIGAALGFGLGFWQFGALGALVGGLGGTVLGILLVLLASSQRARRVREQEEEDALSSWAAERGLLYDDSPPVFRDTPLLYSGDVQEGRYGFTGEIFALRGTVYEHITRYQGKVSAEPGTIHHYLVLHLVFELPGIDLLLIRPRLAIFPHLAAALANRIPSIKEVELESASLSERCRIEVNQSWDELQVRRVLTSQATALLADLCESEVFAAGLFVEAEAGKLVIATPGQIDPENLNPVEDFLAAVRSFVVYLQEFAARSTSGPLGTTRSGGRRISGSRR